MLYSQYQTLYFSFPKEPRFQYGGIYRLTDHNSPQKKNQESVTYLLNKMRKEMAESEIQGNSKIRQLRKRNDNLQRLLSKKKEKKKINKYFQLNFDRYGIRSLESQSARVTNFDRFKNQVQLKDFLKTTSSKFFGGCQRLDFRRPLNFNPGPGHYTKQVSTVRTSLSKTEALERQRKATDRQRVND